MYAVRPMTSRKCAHLAAGVFGGSERQTVHTLYRGLDGWLDTYVL